MDDPKVLLIQINANIKALVEKSYIQNTKIF